MEAGVPKCFSIAQRGTALLLPMPKLFIIGFGATLAGYGLIAGLESLTAVRTQSKMEAAARADPKLARRNLKKAKKAHPCPHGDDKPPVPVLGSGLAVGVFLAVWTNFRYQVRSSVSRGPSD